MSSEHLIFVGFELTDAVAALIDGCADRDKAYLEDPVFLETVTIEGRQYLGKRVKDGIAIDRIEDAARSVVSLLVRVNGEWSLQADQARVLAVEDQGDAVNADAVAGFDYSELVE